MAEVEVVVEQFSDLDQTAEEGYMALFEKQEAEVARQKAEVARQQAIAQPDTAAEEGGGANNAADSAEKPNEDGAAERVEDADEMEPDESSRGNATPVNRTAVNRPSHCKLNWGDTYRGVARVVEGKGWGRSRHMPTSADRVPAQPPAVGEPAEAKPAEAAAGEEAAAEKEAAAEEEAPAEEAAAGEEAPAE